jgi:hypothetical protein
LVAKEHYFNDQWLELAFKWQMVVTALLNRTSWCMFCKENLITSRILILYTEDNFMHNYT